MKPIQPQIFGTERLNRNCECVRKSKKTFVNISSLHFRETSIRRVPQSYLIPMMKMEQQMGLALRKSTYDVTGGEIVNLPS